MQVASRQSSFDYFWLYQGLPVIWFHWNQQKKLVFMLKKYTDQNDLPKQK